MADMTRRPGGMDRAGAVMVQRAAGNWATWRSAEAAHSQTMPASGTRDGHPRPAHRAQRPPHSSPDGAILVVQNGIVENFHDLRAELRAEGYVFLSDTDTEVIAHLIHRFYHNGCGGDWSGHALLLAGARPKRHRRHEQDQPRPIAALGYAGGVAAGERTVRRSGERMPAILSHTDGSCTESGQMAVVERGASATARFPATRRTAARLCGLDRGGSGQGRLRLYMEKEIYEQASLTARCGHLDVENRAELYTQPRRRKAGCAASGASWRAARATTPG